MNLNDIKPLGAFIENTIRPLIEESKEILNEFQRQGINVTSDHLVELTKKVANLHLRTVFIQALRDITIAIIIAGILWKTLAS